MLNVQVIIGTQLSTHTTQRSSPRMILSMYVCMQAYLLVKQFGTYSDYFRRRMSNTCMGKEIRIEQKESKSPLALTLVGYTSLFISLPWLHLHFMFSSAPPPVTNQDEFKECENKMTKPLSICLSHLHTTHLHSQFS